MDQATLVVIGPDLNEGQRLLDRLEHDGIPVAAALWYLEPGSTHWRLIISSPLFENLGPLDAYEVIQRSLARLEGTRLALDDTAARPPSEPIVRALRKVYRDLPQRGYWLQGTVVDGVYIDNAYLYFVK